MTAVWATVARSHRIDPRIAASELVESFGVAQGERARPRVALIYTDVLHDHAALLQELRTQLPDTLLVGATSAGASTAGYCSEDTRFAVAAFLGGEGLAAWVASTKEAALNPHETGIELARKLLAGRAAPTAPYVCLLWYSPLHGIDAEALVGGLESAGLRNIFGGGSGQPWGPLVGTHQFAGEVVLSEGAVAVLLEGVEAVAESTHGMEPVGVEFVVTKVDKNIIYEFNGRRALDVWRDYFGIETHDSAESVASWGIGIKQRASDGAEHLITRSAFTVDREQRSMTLQVPMAVGTVVQLCARTQAAVLDGAKNMGARLASRLSGRTPLLALSFECAARSAPFLGSVLARSEVLDLQQQIGSELPWLGMYAWGEVAPLGERAYIHNYAFPLCVLCAAG